MKSTYQTIVNGIGALALIASTGCAHLTGGLEAQLENRFECIGKATGDLSIKNRSLRESQARNRARADYLKACNGQSIAQNSGIETVYDPSTNQAYAFPITPPKNN